MVDKFQYAVIGSGPGGYVSAIRAGQLGLKTVLIEKEERLGGTCLNVGCIPSKAMLESSEMYYSATHAFEKNGIKVGKLGLDIPAMVANKQDIVNTLTDGIRLLMKKNKVTVLQGTGELVNEHTIRVNNGDEVSEIEAENICLAMGSVPIELPFMKFDGKHIVSSTEALAFSEVPESLIVIGAGAVGLEMGSVWSRLGSKVTVIEMLPQAAPFADKQIAVLLQRSLKSQGIEIMLETKVTGAQVKKGKVIVSYEDKKGNKETIEGTKVLVAVGRRAFSGSANVEKAGVTIEKGKIPVNNKWQTNVPHIYAIGDLIHGPMLAHKAEEEGMAVAEILAGKHGHVNYDIIPNIIYTHPELATVGLGEETAKEAGFDVQVGKFYFRGNGRALTLGDADGLCKLIADKKTDRLLGAQIVGVRASDMIAELVTAMEFQASAEDIARTMHAHPTLSEIVKEAALAVDKRAIHG
ncbi:dihydrolipoyl dehydrogenase [bacterium]|nr:dihydrolipoyl dehydrogenase [bacterium]